MEPSIHRSVTSSQAPNVIRGIALLGMLIINSQTYSLFAFLTPQQVYQLQLDRSDAYVPMQFFIYLFVKGPFEMIYSFLFGFWFYKQWESDKQADLDADRIAQLRLVFLLVLGVTHGIIFWSGDILHLYALLGFSLLYFAKRSVPSLGKWIVGLVLLAILLPFGQVLIQPKGATEVIQRDLQMENILDQLLTSWQQGSIWDVMTNQRMAIMMRYRIAFTQGLSSYILHETMLLIGLIASKLGLPYRITRLKVRFSLFLLLLFPVAFLIKSFSVLLELGLVVFPAIDQACQPLLVSVSTFIGTLLLTMVYLLEMGLNVRLRPSGWMMWVGRVGQMGLSNYLLQTLLCSILFYGYGLGLSGHLTLLESLIPVLGIYVLQVVSSNLWLRYYQQGPVEYLWHRITYGKSIPSNQTATVRL
ncbi:DUF418 domain-containing protein [Spirosoma arboris]|nr:DUF418 domain-containing protein [Spirosoma arboris]